MRSMKKMIAYTTAAVLAAATAQAQGAKPLAKCAGDAVVAGTVCMDKYEASVWRIADPLGAGKSLVKKVKAGKATAADLNAGGATQLGTMNDNYAPCTDNGQNCADDIYAVSLPGERPAAYITWFQAQQACANSAKRLPSNAEWQVAVAGTPDPGPDDDTNDCNTTFQSELVDPFSTGGRANCVSARGAFDMVGNLTEWVADWNDAATNCTDWASHTGLPGGDISCFGGSGGMTYSNPERSLPSALLRGGAFDGGSAAGPLLVVGLSRVSDSDGRFGFRCAR